MFKNTFLHRTPLVAASGNELLEFATTKMKITDTLRIFALSHFRKSFHLNSLIGFWKHSETFFKEYRESYPKQYFARETFKLFPELERKLLKES